ncbi:MAG: transcriptional regulator [Nitrosopumilus sp.]|nr:transcriptional regulator [Nitrosopumilus sp.]MDH3736377.1 transcriptional regulator [Nitrosopumilus sp.]MDH3823886.1 transcriptional regulator [Nitrosopumilus sp.]MDH3833436.1 transcriptional regulator [Nitrosopumilus sp.]
MLENDLDALLVSSFRRYVEDNLGKEMLNKIEQRLLERHGVSLVQAIQNFHKLDDVLREFFGVGANGLEQKLLQNIVNIEKPKQSNSNWIQIKDSKLAKIFLESFVEQDKNSIIGSVIDTPLVISDIIEKSKISKTSGYRKINFLINHGLLVPNGFELGNNGKKVAKYEAIFENIRMDVDKNLVVVKIQLKKNLQYKSPIFQTVPIYS